LALGMIASANEAEAKRLAPKEVPSVVVGGIRFKVPHFGALHDKPQNGGYVQAWDVKKGKLLWDRMVYRVRYEANLEKDVQDDFISEMTVKGGRLLPEDRARREVRDGSRVGEGTCAHPAEPTHRGCGRHRDAGRRPTGRCSGPGFARPLNATVVGRTRC
jgi:hypothetical protein